MLAVEADGTILAVGFNFGVGTGVYRVSPTTGVATALNDSYGWQMPTGVAITAAGDIYVADAGVCADGMCAGGEIVHVDPSTGAVTPLSAGGLIGGELDLVVLPEPGAGTGLAAGIAVLLALGRRRLRSPR